jgi:hypothetical protein
VTEHATTDAPSTGAPAAGAAATDVAVTDVATTAPFTMVSGDASAMVCEGDVCFVPDASSTAQ